MVDAEERLRGKGMYGHVASEVFVNSVSIRYSSTGRNKIIAGCKNLTGM